MHKKTQEIWSILCKKPLFTAIGILLSITIVLFALRFHEAILLAKHTIQSSVQNVQTIVPKKTSMTEHIILPGSLLAWHEAPVFARAKGYLKVWYVDIGYKVHKGDVLAIIERPELDAQLREAEDYLKTVMAQNTLAQITATRWGKLVKTDSVSKQANDNKRYEAAALAAEVSKARANVEKLRAYVSFEQVIAPFSGTISLRQTDIGALVNIGSNPAEAQPLFNIVQTNPMRLYVNIPQTYATRVTPNMRVNLEFVEHPGQIFSAKLLKTAGAINPVTLTLQAEFRVNNKNGILLPGSYSVVDFSLPTYPESIIVPVNALIFQAAGLQVAIVNPDNHVDLKKVTIGTDFGSYVQINSGIRPGDRVILNPIDSLYQGQYVNISNSKEKSTV